MMEQRYDKKVKDESRKGKNCLAEVKNDYSGRLFLKDKATDDHNPRKAMNRV